MTVRDIRYGQRFTYSPSSDMVMIRVDGNGHFPVSMEYAMDAESGKLYRIWSLDSAAYPAALPK